MAGTFQKRDDEGAEASGEGDPVQDPGEGQNKQVCCVHIHACSLLRVGMHIFACASCFLLVLGCVLFEIYLRVAPYLFDYAAYWCPSSFRKG